VSSHHQLYAVIPDAGTGLNGAAAEIFVSETQAVQFADAGNRDATEASVPVHHRVFVLTEMSESGHWDWGVQAPGERVLEYVNERAARSSARVGLALVRRRLGAELWEAVSTGE
jgi:hypothetical protein